MTELVEQKVLEKLNALERRLYRDNGVLSIQTRLDRLTVAHNQNQWLARAAIMAVIGHIVASILATLK